MAKVILYSQTDNVKQINEANIDVDKSHLQYIDNDGSKVDIGIDDTGIQIKSISIDHETFLSLKEDGYAKISTNEGDLTIPLKVVAFTINNDKIVVHYSIEDELRVIEIIY